MAPPRKKRSAPSQSHSVHLNLPGDVFARLDAKAKKSMWPLNRIVINELAAYPQMEQEARLAELVRDMEVVLARYGSRISVSDMNAALIEAVDRLLAAQGRDVAAAMDRLKVARRAMLTKAALDERSQKP
jgi:hypothetical protein